MTEGRRGGGGEGDEDPTAQGRETRTAATVGESSPFPPPLAPGAARFALPPLVAALPAAVVAPAVGAGLVALAAAIVYFFRDPPRAPDLETDEGVEDGTVLAPCDGRVSVVRVETDDAGRERVLVGTFMSPLDVHVVRAPLAGRVTTASHDPGGHWPAFSKASERNERLRLAIAGDDSAGGAGGAGERDRGDARARDADADADADHEVTLITGALARRVTPYVADGHRLRPGDRLGHIAFGSRTDVRLPPAYGPTDLRVAEGDAVRAGESVLARRE
jgi:phosphatidylserine decarboxylase